MRWSRIYWFVVLLVLIAISFGVWFLRSHDNRSALETPPVATIAEEPVDSLEIYLEFDKNRLLEPVGLVDSMMTTRLALYSLCSSDLQKAQERNDTNLTQSARELKELLLADQIKNFPPIRKAFGMQADAAIWLEDMDCSISGPQNRFITFTGAALATNRSKQENFDKLKDLLKMYRFTKATFRSSTADPGATFLISSASDSVVVMDLVLSQ